MFSDRQTWERQYPKNGENNYFIFLIGRRERNIMPTLRRASLNLINI
jgi:hypothetical protein